MPKGVFKRTDAYRRTLSIAHLQKCPHGIIGKRSCKDCTKLIKKRHELKLYNIKHKTNIILEEWLKVPNHKAILCPHGILGKKKCKECKKNYQLKCILKKEKQNNFLARLCACGCGKLAKPNRKYIGGHFIKSSANPSKSAEHKEKMRNIFLANHPMKNPIIKAKHDKSLRTLKNIIAVSERMKATNLKYKSTQTRISGTAKRVEQYLIELGIKYTQEKLVLNDKQKAYHWTDFFLNEYNTCLEVDGCWWHGCLECFNPLKFMASKQGKENWNQIYQDDVLNQRMLNKDNIVIRYWEHEINEPNFKEKLKKHINQISKNIGEINGKNISNW